jgi:hypothetical protein
LNLWTRSVGSLTDGYQADQRSKSTSESAAQDAPLALARQ